MIINVTRDNVAIDGNSIRPHENEYNITQCHFTFDDFIDSFQVKRVIFTIESTGEMYENDIIDYECEIPSEILRHEYETIKVGVYGYNIGENEELVDRFSPSYDTFVVPTGSYKEGALSPEPITPSQYDIYSNKLQEGLDAVGEALEEVSNVNISAEQLEDGASITITDRNGHDETVTIHDGEKGDTGAQGPQGVPGYTPKKGIDYFTTSEINDIEDTVKNQVKTDLDFDNTINGIESDIEDLQQELTTQGNQIEQNKTDIATINTKLVNYSLITETGSKITLTIDNTTYQMYVTLKDKNNNTISTSNVIDLPIEQLVMSVTYDNDTKEIVITLQNGNITRVPVGALISGLVSETQLNTILESYTTKAYVDGLVGDIGTLLDEINGEVIGG